VIEAELELALEAFLLSIMTLSYTFLVGCTTFELYNTNLLHKLDVSMQLESFYYSFILYIPWYEQTKNIFFKDVKL